MPLLPRASLAAVASRAMRKLAMNSKIFEVLPPPARASSLGVRRPTAAVLWIGCFMG